MADSQFYRPGLPQLISMIRSDLLTRFEQDTLLRRMDAEVYARVQAAAVHTLYGYIDYLARNLLPDMCDEDWLYRHARIKRCPRKDAVSARGFVRWDGVEGTPVLPAGTQIQRDDQVTFTTTATVTAADGLLRVPVVADEPGRRGIRMMVLPCNWEHPSVVCRPQGTRTPLQTVKILKIWKYGVPALWNVITTFHRGRRP